MPQILALTSTFRKYQQNSDCQYRGHLLEEAQPVPISVPFSKSCFNTSHSVRWQIWQTSSLWTNFPHPFFPVCVVSSILFCFYILCCFFAVVSVTIVTGTSTDTTVSPLSSESIRSDSSSKGRCCCRSFFQSRDYIMLNRLRLSASWLYRCLWRQ